MAEPTSTTTSPTSTSFAASIEKPWPALPLAAWPDTFETLHRWTQIVGKVRLSLSPWLNHSWHATLYVTARGLTTSLIPYGARTFEIDLDFVEHQLAVRCCDGASAVVPLEPQSVAAFYRRLMHALERLGLSVRIHGRPNELPDAIPFAEDERHASYDRVYANRFWRVLVESERVLSDFRSRFAGKCSPVHFFWGGADLAVTRFSGRRAPEHPGGVPNLPDWVTRDAYSHEVSSAGFWPGGPGFEDAAFYSYAYPEPPGFAAAQVEPAAAFYSPGLREFLLPYEAVRRASDPTAALMAFLQTTYDAAATLGRWDRAALERPPVVARGPGPPRPARVVTGP